MSLSYSPSYSTPPPPPPKRGPGLATASHTANPAAGHEQTTATANEAIVQPESAAGAAVLKHPDPSWLPSFVTEQTNTTAVLEAMLNQPGLLASVPHHPEEQPIECARAQAAVRDGVQATAMLAAHVEQLEKTVRQQRDEVQAQLLAVSVLARQYQSELEVRDSHLEAFRPRLLFQQLCRAVEEADADAKRVEHAFLASEPTSGGGGNGEPEIATERQVVDYVKRLRDAHRTAFLRRQRKERWEEGRVGGWRY